MQQVLHGAVNLMPPVPVIRPYNNNINYSTRSITHNYMAQKKKPTKAMSVCKIVLYLLYPGSVFYSPVSIRGADHSPHIRSPPAWFPGWGPLLSHPTVAQTVNAEGRQNIRYPI